MKLEEIKPVPISYILKEYCLSKYTIYHAIKSDPSFPILYLGPKKNFRVDLNKFVPWLMRRLMAGDHNKIPTPKELLEVSHAL